MRGILLDSMTISCADIGGLLTDGGLTDGDELPLGLADAGADLEGACGLWRFAGWMGFH